jgi:putative membrane protein
VPTYVKHAQARHLAHREFHAHFADDKSTACILFFVSLGEHYVEIIADHETHARVPSNAWNKIVSDFSAAIAQSSGGRTARPDRIVRRGSEYALPPSRLN